MFFMLLIYMSNYVSIEYYLELVWIGCLQILNARFRQNVICQIVWLHKISTFAFSKSIFFTFAKHCKALLFQKRRGLTAIFFLQKIKIALIRQEIPALSLPPCISPPLFSQSFYTSSMYICYSVLSVSMSSQFSVPTSTSFFILLAR